jgi:hypothetical protein
MESQDDPEWFVNAGSKAKSGKYNWAKRIVIDSLVDPKKYPLLQLSYVKAQKKVIQYRIEFVPVDLGPEGMLHLHTQLGGLMEDGWGAFVKHGRITRLDVAVDLPMTKIDDFHFLPVQLVTTTVWRRNGKLQGYLLGKKEGNQTEVYDRKQKRIDLGKSWKGKEGARIERRLRNTKLTLPDLPGMANPFAGMSLVGMPEAPPSEQTKMLYVWNLFRRAADTHVLATILALLPEEKKTLYRKHLEAHKKSWWTPDAIWASWPAMLDALKIASPTAWE